MRQPIFTRLLHRSSINKTTITQIESPLGPNPASKNSIEKTASAPGPSSLKDVLASEVGIYQTATSFIKGLEQEKKQRHREQVRKQSKAKEELELKRRSRTKSELDLEIALGIRSNKSFVGKSHLESLSNLKLEPGLKRKFSFHTPVMVLSPASKALELRNQCLETLANEKYLETNQSPKAELSELLSELHINADSNTNTNADSNENENANTDYAVRPPKIPIKSKICSIQMNLQDILANEDPEFLLRYEKCRTIPEVFKEVTEELAIDCEFIGGERNCSLLGRVSIVNKYGYPVYDVYVEPTQRVTDYRTRYSGISARTLEEARKNGTIRSRNQVINKIHALFSQSILIGHSVCNDLRVLKIINLVDIAIDTQVLRRFAEDGLSQRPGLKNVIRRYYGIEIQKGRKGHCSVEDARSAMLIYRTFKNEYLSDLKIN